MAKEIERQFVVNTKHPEWIKLSKSLPVKRYIQAVLHNQKGSKFRVRLIEDIKTGKKEAAFTFKLDKRSTKDAPNIREEYEWEVPYRVGLYLMVGQGEVHKLRKTYIHTDGKMWEIDEYEWANEGIVLADIELKNINDTIDLPEWIGSETTKLKKITNNSFSLHPFANWSESEKKWYKDLETRNEETIKQYKTKK